MQMDPDDKWHDFQQVRLLKTHCCQPQERSSPNSQSDFSFSTKIQPISIIKTVKYTRKQNQPIDIQSINAQSNKQ